MNATRSQRASMKEHACAILGEGEHWNRPVTSRLPETSNQSQFKAITPRLLYYLISESFLLGGTLLEQFWEAVGQCDPRLKENVAKLQQTEFSDNKNSVNLLFEGLDRHAVKLDGIFSFSAEIFTHLGVAIVNSAGGSKSSSDTPSSVSEVVEIEMQNLLKFANENSGARKQAALKELVFRRDGHQCLITDLQFSYKKGEWGAIPQLSHIIPNSWHKKPGTLKVLGMFAGTDAVDLVRDKLNTVENALNLQANAREGYDCLSWGIEAQVQEGTIKYVYRNIPSTAKTPILVRLVDGDEIKFGGDPQATGIPLPDPLFCNIQLALARVLKMSGAASLLHRLSDEADDSDIPHSFIASDEFADILTAKLLISGSAPIL